MPLVHSTPLNDMILFSVISSKFTFTPTSKLNTRNASLGGLNLSQREEEKIRRWGTYTRVQINHFSSSSLHTNVAVCADYVVDGYSAVHHTSLAGSEIADNEVGT
jgi:hypothetical protein